MIVCSNGHPFWPNFESWNLRSGPSFDTWALVAERELSQQMQHNYESWVLKCTFWSETDSTFVIKSTSLRGQDPELLNPIFAPSQDPEIFAPSRTSPKPNLRLWRSAPRCCSLNISACVVVFRRIQTQRVELRATHTKSQNGAEWKFQLKLSHVQGDEILTSIGTDLPILELIEKSLNM